MFCGIEIDILCAEKVRFSLLEFLMTCVSKSPMTLHFLTLYFGRISDNKTYSVTMDFVSFLFGIFELPVEVRRGEFNLEFLWVLKPIWIFMIAEIKLPCINGLFIKRRKQKHHFFSFSASLPFVLKSSSWNAGLWI